MFACELLFIKKYWFLSTWPHAWTKCGIWESRSQEILLLEGNRGHFEWKFITQMDISVFFSQKYLKMCKIFKNYDIPGKFAFFRALYGPMPFETNLVSHFPLRKCSISAHLSGVKPCFQHCCEAS